MVDDTATPSLLQRLEPPSLASRISTASSGHVQLQDRLSDPPDTVISPAPPTDANPDDHEAERPATPAADAPQHMQDTYSQVRAAWISRGKRPQGRPSATPMTTEQRAMFEAARSHANQVMNAINDPNYVVPLRPHGLPPHHVHPRFMQWYEDELAWVVAANATWHDHRELARTTATTRGDPFVVDALGDPPAPFVIRARYNPYLWGGPPIAELSRSTLVSISVGGGYATRSTPTRTRTNYTPTTQRPPPLFYSRASIDPPAPHEYADSLEQLRRDPEDHSEITAIDQLRLPTTTDEIRLITANAQRPGNTVALKMVGHLFDIANHPRDLTISIELREFLLAIRWKRPQWAKDREFKEFDARTKDKYRRGYTAPQIRVADRRSPIRSNSPSTSTSTLPPTRPHPPFDPRLVTEWETWLRTNPGASFPGLDRLADGRAANRDALRGMLLVASMGPALPDHTGRDAFMRYSIFVQRTNSAISPVTFSNTTPRWTPSTPVTLDSVRAYWASAVTDSGFGAHILSDQNCVRKWLMALGRDGSLLP